MEDQAKYHTQIRNYNDDYGLRYRILDEIKTKLINGCGIVEQEHLLREMFNHCRYVGVGIYDFLKNDITPQTADKIKPQALQTVEKTQNVLPDNAIESIICKGCGKTFLIGKGWNGHGESRCIKKNLKKAIQLKQERSLKIYKTA